jgi:hypothetical protein
MHEMKSRYCQAAVLVESLVHGNATASCPLVSRLHFPMFTRFRSVYGLDGHAAFEARLISSGSFLLAICSFCSASIAGTKRNWCTTHRYVHMHVRDTKAARWLRLWASMTHKPTRYRDPSCHLLTDNCLQVSLAQGE